jgi:hypothetical protein
MLRIEFQATANITTIWIEGRFGGMFARDTQQLVVDCRVPSSLVVNLSKMISVDAVGQEVLSWLGSLGAKFVAENAYSLDVCERLHLPMARKRANSASNKSGDACKPCPRQSPGDEPPGLA